MTPALLAPLLAAMTAQAPHDADELKSSAAAWLALVDQGAYEKSWHQASPSFRENMTRFGKGLSFWTKALNVSRAPLGALLSRSVVSSKETTGMPGGPGGPYVELVYESRFAEADAVTETVVLTKDDDSEWRVFNYVIVRQTGPPR